MAGAATSDKHARKKRVFRDFSKDDKLKAVAAALATNPDRPTGVRAVQAVNDAIGVPIDRSVLWDWIHEYRDEVTALLPPRKTTAEIVQETQAEITEQFQRTRRAYTEQLLKPETVGRASARDSAVVVGIMSDHLNKLNGALPFDMQHELDVFYQHCATLGLEPLQAMKDVNAMLASKIPTLADVMSQGKPIAIEANVPHGDAEK